MQLPFAAMLPLQGTDPLCLEPDQYMSAYSVNEHCGPSQSWYSLYATALTATLSCTWKASESMGGIAAPSSLSMEQAPNCLCAAGWAVSSMQWLDPQFPVCCKCSVLAHL